MQEVDNTLCVLKLPRPKGSEHINQTNGPATPPQDLSTVLYEQKKPLRDAVVHKLHRSNAFRVQQTALELVYVHKNAVGVGGWRIEERCSESYWFTERPARDPVTPTNAEALLTLFSTNLVHILYVT